jgi:hypothetical protein
VLRRAATRGLEIVSAGLLGITLAAAYAGPLRFDIFGTSLSVRTLSRPLLAALLLLITRLWLTRDLRLARAAGDVLSRVVLGALIVGGVTGWLTFLSTTCGGADSYGYVSAAERLLSGDLVHEERLASVLPFPDAIAAATPLGYVPAGRRPNASVPAYPLGLPAVMAVARALAGPTGPFTVAPLAGLVLLAATYLTAVSWYGNPLIGLLACALVALNPLVFTYCIQPMSDVPAAAAVLLAIALLSRASSWPFMAGIAASVALFIRPALAPVAIAFALLPIVKHSSRHWLQTLRYLIPVTGAVFVQGWTQWYLYGHPLASGYGSIADLFSPETIATNLRIYSYWSFRALGPTWLGAVAIGLAVSGRLPRVAVLTTLVMIIVPYLLYRPYDHWETLRFLLPIITVATIAAAAGLMAVTDRVTGAGHPNAHTTRVRDPGAGGPVLATVLAAAMGVTWMSWLSTNGVFMMPEDERRHRLAGELVAQATPHQSVILALQHSGSLRYYAQRETLNWDRIPAGALNATVQALQEHGLDVFVMIDSDAERVMFEKRHGAIIDEQGWLPGGQRRNVQLFQAPRHKP